MKPRAYYNEWDKPTAAWLRELIKHGLIMDGDVGGGASPSSRKSSDDERQRVLDALAQCAGNQTEAAKVLGISRRTLVSRLDAYGIARPRKREV